MNTRIATPLVGLLLASIAAACSNDPVDSSIQGGNLDPLGAVITIDADESDEPCATEVGGAAEAGGDMSESESPCLNGGFWGDGAEPDGDCPNGGFWGDGADPNAP